VPSRMVGVSASVNLPLHHKVQKFSSGIGSHGWSRKKAIQWLCVCVLGNRIMDQKRLNFGTLGLWLAHMVFASSDTVAEVCAV